MKVLLLSICLSLFCTDRNISETVPTMYEVVMINHVEQEILFLSEDKVLNSRGDTLAHYEGDDLYNHINQKIGYVKGQDIYNMIDQKIGSVANSELVNANGQGIMRLEGGTLREQAKLGAAYFFFL